MFKIFENFSCCFIQAFVSRLKWRTWNDIKGAGGHAPVDNVRN